MTEYQLGLQVLDGLERRPKPASKRNLSLPPDLRRPDHARPGRTPHGQQASHEIYVAPFERYGLALTQPRFGPQQHERLSLRMVLIASRMP